jgi:hypothetical protein
VAKADLVPTEANLLLAYGSFKELVVACEEQMVILNQRPHRATKRPPLEMLAEERQHLHTLPHPSPTPLRWARPRPALPYKTSRSPCLLLFEAQRKGVDFAAIGSECP